MVTRPQRLVVYVDAAGLWRWRLVAGNNRVVAASEQGHRRRRYVVRKARKLHPDAQLVVEYPVGG